LNEKRGAILADEMGLGKTLMTITTIVSLHRRNRSERFIVICPSSLVSNWAQEFDKFLGKASQPHRVVIRKGGEEGLQKLKSFVQMKHTSEGALKCVCHNVILFVMNP
jgi:DNA repair and recombination protein RAD54 and RAD54-like protein